MLLASNSHEKCCAKQEEEVKDIWSTIVATLVLAPKQVTPPTVKANAETAENENVTLKSEKRRRKRLRWVWRRPANLEANATLEFAKLTTCMHLNNLPKWQLISILSSCVHPTELSDTCFYVSAETIWYLLLFLQRRDIYVIFASRQGTFCSFTFSFLFRRNDKKKKEKKEKI